LLASRARTVVVAAGRVGGYDPFAVWRQGKCGDRLVGEPSDLASMDRSGPAPLAAKAKLLANDLAAAGYRVAVRSGADIGN